MHFVKGDWFEVTGGVPREVVYADEETFVCRNYVYSPGVGWQRTNHLSMLSNKEADFDGIYWVKKIPPISDFSVATLEKLR